MRGEVIINAFGVKSVARRTRKDPADDKGQPFS